MSDPRQSHPDTEQHTLRDTLVIVLSALAFIVAVTVGSYWFARIWWCPPSNAGEFGDTFGLAGAILTGLPIVLVVLAMYFQQKEYRAEIKELQGQKVHQLLSTALFEFRSVEMFAAVKHLWDFYRDHGDSWRKLIDHHHEHQADQLLPTMGNDQFRAAAPMVEAYMRIMDNEQAEINALDRSERLTAEASTLHYRRQLVSRYYQYLAGLAHEGIVHPDVIYRYWNRGVLRIVPSILEPIERALDEKFNFGLNKKYKGPRRLYDESPMPLGDSSVTT